MRSAQTISAPKPATSSFVVFHGTAVNYLDSFQTSSPRVYQYNHVERRAFCTSTDFDEASRFAIRHTPANDLNSPGVVLEFDASAVSPRNYAHAKDRATMWDEREVVFFDTRKLRLVAVWRLLARGWERAEIELGCNSC